MHAMLLSKEDKQFLYKLRPPRRLCQVARPSFLWPAQSPLHTSFGLFKTMVMVKNQNELEATSQLQLRTAPFFSPEQLLAEAADDEDHCSPAFPVAASRSG
jgi:hypothetical protein